MGDRPEAVLFACTQNSGRSPMAESLLKHLLGHRIYVDSVGVRGRELDPFVIEVMDEIGIDLSRHRPKSFDNLEDTSFDLIISLSPEAQHQAVELTRTMACDVEFWNTFRSEEHTSELQSLMRISYAVFCLKNKNMHTNTYEK